MSHRYQHILSPVKVGKKQLKNHLLQSKCSLPPKSVEEAEEFYLRMAKNGASLVTVWVGNYPGRDMFKSNIEFGMISLNMFDEHVREEFRKMNKKLHAEGTLSSASLMDIEPVDVAISDTPNWDEIPAHGDYNTMTWFNKPGISAELLEKMLQEFVWRCCDFYTLGFDAVTFYMSYRASILANSLSPVLNQRTDKYGGKTMKERATLTLELFRRIKEACPDLIIEVQISGEEEAPGYTMNDWLEYCRLCEGLVDIFQVRGLDGSSTHVCGFNMQPHQPPNLRFAEAFRKAGIKALVSPVGGFGDPDDIERYIAEGKTDLVSMARRFISDREFIAKLVKERGEDMVPCLLCNRCHGKHRCAVEPVSLNIGKKYTEPRKSKKVAVVGGGPAGLQAALTASKRGHSVTLYEKSGKLGGQLKFADYPGFKWPLRDYRDWLISQVEKSNVKILTGTEAAPGTIKAEGYDAVICALGSVVKNIPVPGADSDFVWAADDVYGHEAELGKRVVVIGGATTGRETALYLAECGHKVTMITRTQAALFGDLHAQRAEEDAALLNPNFSYIEHAETKEIHKGYLICEVKLGIPKVKLGFGGFIIKGHMAGLDGMPGMYAKFDESNMTIESRKVEFDSLIISGGRSPLTGLAESFRDTAPEFYIIGDNTEPGDVMDCNETAYDAAMRL